MPDPDEELFAGRALVFVFVDDCGKVGAGSASSPTPEAQPAPSAPTASAIPVNFSHSQGIIAELRMLFFKVCLVSIVSGSCRWAPSRTARCLGLPRAAAGLTA